MIDRVPDELWMEVCDIVQGQGTRPSPRKRNAEKKIFLLSEEALNSCGKKRSKKKRRK